MSAADVHFGLRNPSEGDPAPEGALLSRLILALGAGATLGVVATAVVWSSSPFPPRYSGASFHRASVVASREFSAAAIRPRSEKSADSTAQAASSGQRLVLPKA